MPEVGDDDILVKVEGAESAEPTLTSSKRSLRTDSGCPGT